MIRRVILARHWHGTGDWTEHNASGAACGMAMGWYGIGMASWFMGAAGLDRNENRTIPPAASAVLCIWLGFDETSCRAVDCDGTDGPELNKEGAGRATGGGWRRRREEDCRRRLSDSAGEN